MRMRPLFLAGAVLSLASGDPLAFSTMPAQAEIVLAQRKQACPEGTECPPGEQAPRRQRQREAPAAEQQQGQPQTRKQRQKQQRQEEAAPVAEQQGQPEQRRQRRKQQQQEQSAPAAEQQGQPEQRRQRRKQQQQEQAPAAERAAPKAEQPTARENRRQRAKRQQQEEQQQGAPAEQATPEEPAAGQEGRTQRRQRDRKPQQGQPAREAPGADEQQQGAPEAAPGDRRQRALERARQRQQQLQQGEQGGATGEAGEEQPRRGRPAQLPEEEAGPVRDSTVEQQLKAQGDQAEAGRVRDLRQKLRGERQAAREAAPQEDEAGARPRARDRHVRPSDRGREGRPRDRDRDRGRVVERRGDRVIINIGGNIVIRHIVPDDRLLYRARDVNVTYLPGGRTRTVVYRENGLQIVTIRDRYGNIIQRFRRFEDGRQFFLINNDYYQDDYYELPPPILYDLPPPVVSIPQDQYIVDLGAASQEQIYATLRAPPVQPVEQPYTLEEITSNETLRDYVPRIDLDSITFEFGSSTIGGDQMDALVALGEAMQRVVSENAGEVYLIEGHTDAVGSDNDNLILSDERAEAVAVALSQNFEIPPENLVTEGYGEQYLKVDTEGEERQNRRVTVRRITPLLAQGEQTQAEPGAAEGPLPEGGSSEAPPPAEEDTSEPPPPPQ